MSRVDREFSGADETIALRHDDRICLGARAAPQSPRMSFPLGSVHRRPPTNIGPPSRSACAEVEAFAWHPAQLCMGRLLACVVAEHEGLPNPRKVVHAIVTHDRQADLALVAAWKEAQSALRAKMYCPHPVFGAIRRGVSHRNSKRPSQGAVSRDAFAFVAVED